MGFFKRTVEQVRAERPPFGTAAFDPADVDDARRGRPDRSLEGFAAATGLAFKGTEQAGQFVSTLPTWPDYVFNVCRGTLPGGRYGMVDHELYEVRAHNGSVAAAGRFHDLHVPPRVGTLEVGGIEQGSKNEPFWGNAAWLPTTSVHVRAPETNRVPVLRFVRSSSHGLEGDNGLDGYGAPGYRTLGPDLPPETLAPLATAAAPWLAGRVDAHSEVRVRFGIVAVTVNGYRVDEADLRHLVLTGESIADALAALTPPALPTSIDAPGPPVGAGSGAGPGFPEPHPTLVPLYAAQASHWGLHQEDPGHVLALLPRCPIPGRPSGVLFGVPPGCTAPARVVWFEQGGRTASSARGGLIAPAPRGASTPLGGVLHAETGVYTEVVDGVAHAWRKQRSFGELEAGLLLESAVATLRSTGLAAI